MIRKAVFDEDDNTTIFLHDEIAEAYQAEMAAFQTNECKHENVTRRIWKLASGSTQLKDFCDICGKRMSNSFKQADYPGEYPLFDEGLRHRYYAVRAEEKRALVMKYIAFQKVQNESLERKVPDWMDEYNAYRRTEKWQRKRFRVLERAEGICEGCLLEPAVLVHHTTYSHVGDELLYQLVALCRDCHQLCHPEKEQRPFYDNDYLPCLDCRWFSHPADCGHTGTKCYVALAPDGECGPKFALFTGLK